jgi:SAM-dependent methyltransferase
MDRAVAALTKELLDLAAPRSGERVLDIGCGASTTVLDLPSRVSLGGHVLGADASEPSVARAQQWIAAAARQSSPNVAVDPFAPNSFDLAFSRFGFMLFSDPQAAFINVRRAMKPGGRLTLAVFRAAGEVVAGGIGAGECRGCGRLDGPSGAVGPSIERAHRRQSPGRRHRKCPDDHRRVAESDRKRARRTPPVTEVVIEVDPKGAISVQDSGPGVSAEDRQRVFERFWRGKGVRTDGAGLGLAIVMENVKAHGASVTVSNRAPSGARFDLRFRTA